MRAVGEDRHRPVSTKTSTHDHRASSSLASPQK